MAGSSRRVLASLALCVVFGVGGTAARVQDAQKSRTYTWVTVGGSGHSDAGTAAQVRTAIDTQLVAKGLTKTEGTADFEVEYWVEVHPEKLSVSTGANMGMGVGGGVRSVPTTIAASETLHLSVYDAATKQVLWQGSVDKSLDEHAKPEKRQKNIDKAVAKLLKRYPAPAK